MKRLWKGNIETDRVCGVILALWFSFSLLHAQEFKASVEKTTISTDEHITLEFVLTGAGMGGGKNLKLPDLSKFLILAGPNQSTSMQIVNGSVNSSVTYSYAIQAREAGKFTLGAATIEAGGKQYSSQPITITVVKGTAKPSQPAGANQSDTDIQLGDNLFLRAIVDRTRVYQGEQITVTFKVYTRVRITNYSINKLPTMTGFWGEELTLPQQVTLGNETVGGKQYQVGVLKKMALFPTQSGTLEINPLEIICQVQVQSKKKSNDWFDQFFNDPFINSLQTSNVNLKSTPARITVLPLPKNDVPASFKGAVGRFALNVSAGKRSLKTNEPFSLKATISGTGNIKILEAPNLELPSDFEKYDPKVTESIDRSSGSVNGSKTFEWLIVPRYPGTKRIPPLEFSYYDPSRGKYVVIRSAPLGLEVEKGSAEAPQLVSGFSKEDVKLLNEDIRFIKTGIGSVKRKRDDSISTAKLLTITLLPLAAFMGLLFYRQKVTRDLSDVVTLRARKAIKVATKRLKEAKLLLSTDRTDAFYAEIARALWAYLADKLGIDTAHLSIDAVVYGLEKKKGTPALILQVKEGLEACEYARFAPASSSPDEKKKMYDIAGNIIIAAEKEIR